MNENSFYYSLNGKTYRPFIVKITANGVYFRMFTKDCEIHTTYHRNGTTGTKITTKIDGKETCFPDKNERPKKIPIKEIKEYVFVETRGYAFSEPQEFIERYEVRNGDIRLFSKMTHEGCINVFMLIGPDIGDFKLKPELEKDTLETEKHTVENNGTKAHVVLVKLKSGPGEI